MKITARYYTDKGIETRDVDLTDDSFAEVVFGESSLHREAVKIHVRRDRVEVVCNSTLILEPRAANVVQVKAATD